MMYVIQVIDTAIPGLEPGCEDKFIASYSEWEDGTFHIELVEQAEDAMQFNALHIAVKFWQTQSWSKPIRPDDKPNRPMTAYTVEILPFESEETTVYKGNGG